MTGFINSYESFATLDGTGIRFAVFFQGCNLRCVYCHNPDTQKNGGGTEVTAEELVRKILRYKSYFTKGGGVTLTGGEPLLQAEFLVELCLLLKKENINIALDTAGNVINENVKKLLPLIDLFILDLKFASEEDYRKYTGGSLAATLEFLELLQQINGRVWLRSVIIPGINDTLEYIDKYKKITEKFPFAEKHELLGFHTLGFQKYERLSMQNPLKDTPPMDVERLKELSERLKF